MLALGHKHNPVGTDVAPAGTTDCEQTVRLAFGGVDFELHGASGLPLFHLDDGHRRCATTNPEAPRIGRVTCTVVADPDPYQPSADLPPLAVACDWHGDSAMLHTKGIRVQICETGPGCFAATAHVTFEADSWGYLLIGLSTAIVYRQGGLCLHAAAAALDGGGYVFTGPSGAGKSTAVRLMEGATLLADDRLALFSWNDRWWVWRLPGGTWSGVRRSEEPTLPLRGVYRVVKHGHSAGIEWTSPSASYFDLVSASFVMRKSLSGAAAACVPEAALMRVLAEVPVGRIRTVLNCDLASLFRVDAGRSCAAHEAYI